MPPFLLALATGCNQSEYEPRYCGNDCPQTEDTADEGFSFELPHMKGCDFLSQVLPFDISDLQNSKSLESFHAYCPLLLDDTYLKECTQKIDHQFQTMTETAMPLVLKGVKILDLIRCKVPITAFYKFEGNNIDQEVSVRVTFDNNEDLIGDYKNNEEIDDNFPFNNLFLSARLVVNENREIKEVSFQLAFLEAHKEFDKEQGLSFSYTSNETYEILNVNNLEYVCGTQGCDYLLFLAGDSLSVLSKLNIDFIKSILGIPGNLSEDEILKKDGRFF